MKKVFALIFMVAAMMTTFTACENEDVVSEAPEFSEIQFSANPCDTEDTIMITVPFAKKGSHFYYNELLLNCKNTDKDGKSDMKILSATRKDASIGQLLGSGEPVLKCIAPTMPGKYTITFTAKISYTGNKVKSGNNYTTQLYGETNKVTATLTVN